MPARNYMVVDARRDHSIRVPRPDVSLDLGTPNACASCHLDRSKSDRWKSYPAWVDAANAGEPLAQEEVRRVNQWSADWIERWFPNSKHRPPHFGYTLAAARQGTPRPPAGDGADHAGHSTSPGSQGGDDSHPQSPADPAALANQATIVADLGRLARDRANVGPIVRATAVSHLDQYPTAEALAINDAALKDEEGMVRLAAARNLDAFFPFQATDLWSYADMPPGQRAALRRQFDALKERAVPLLTDPLRAVRMEAARVLSVVPRMYLGDTEATAFDAALQEFYAGEQEMADQAAAHLNLGTVYGNFKQFDKAIESYQTAIRLDPEFVPAHINLALLYNFQGKNAEAEQLLRQALQHAPQLPDAHYYLGLLLAEDSGRLAEAAESLGEAVKHAPGRPRIRYNYALALDKLGRSREAVSQLEQALELDPDNPDYYQVLITLYARQQRWDQAVRYAKKLAERYPHESQFQQQLQLLRLQQENAGGAGLRPRP